MKSIIESVSPYLCEKIASGDCKILVKKFAPKEVPFKEFIYATRPKKFYKCGAVSTSDELLWLANGKVEMGDGFKFWANGDEYQCLNGHVIGEFVCDRVDKIIPLQHTYYNYIGLPIANITEYGIWNDDLAQMCLKKKEIDNYGKGKTLYGRHISDLKIYDKPKELSEFKISCNRKNPCCSCCNRFTGKPWDICNSTITRPLQSYMFVEEVEQ